MTTEVANVPLFTFQALKNLVNGTDKAKREVGNYKDIDGDYGRLPLLMLGCFCLMVNKFQSWGQYEWGHVVDLGRLGNKVALLTEYWELVDVLQSGSRAFSYIWPLVAELDLTSEKGQQQGIEAAKKAVPYACKALSSAVDLFTLFSEIGALKGFPIHQWRLVGTLSGAIGYTHTLYTNLMNNPNEMEEFKKDLESIKKTAKDTYRAQQDWKVFWSTIMTISILASKIIGFCDAAQNLYNASSVIEFIAQAKDNLSLTSFVTFTVGAVGLSLYNQQMKEFKKENRVI